MNELLQYAPLGLAGLAAFVLIALFAPPKRVAAWLEQLRPLPRAPAYTPSRPSDRIDPVPLRKGTVALEQTGRLVSEALSLVPSLHYLWAPRLSDLIKIDERYAGAQRGIQMTNRLRETRVALAILDTGTLLPAGVLLDKGQDNTIAKALLKGAHIPFVEVRPDQPNVVREAFDALGWALPEARNEPAPSAATLEPIEELDDPYLRGIEDDIDGVVGFEPVELEPAATVAASSEGPASDTSADVEVSQSGDPEAVEDADEVDEPGAGPQSSGDQLDMFPDHDPHRKPGGLKPMWNFSSGPKPDARTGTG